jgi:hemolysin activation/secretion protein
VSSGVVDLGFGLNLGTSRAFPVRGYAVSEVRGRRAATASAELRWPLALVGRSLGHLPAGADKLWLALFADAGDAWDPPAQPHLSHLLAAGAELVADLRLGYDIPMRARIGAAYPLRAPPSGGARRPVAFVALGADF